MPRTPRVDEKPDDFRPPEISLALAASIYVLAFWCDRYLLGLEWGWAPSAVGVAIATKQLLKALDDRDAARDFRKKRKRQRLADEEQGGARLANTADVMAASDFSCEQGIFFGHLPSDNASGRGRWTPRGGGLDVKMCGEGNVLVVAPPGAGKTTKIVIPTAFSLARDGADGPYGMANNLLFNDVACELLPILRPMLEQAGYEVVVLAPFPKEVAALTGQEVVDAGVDVFFSLHPDMPEENVLPELEKVARWVVPDGVNISPDNLFFYDDAREIFVFLAMRRIALGHKPTLADLQEDLSAGPVFFDDLLGDVDDDNHLRGAFGGALAGMARKLRGILAKAGPQFSGGFGVLNQALKPFSTPAMARHSHSSGFDPKRLKSPDKRVAVFVCYTLEKLSAYAGPLSMTLTYLMDTLITAPSERPVTAIIDEAGALRLPRIAEQLCLYRKFQLRVVLIYQDFEGQTRQNYNQAVLQQIVSACHYRIAIGIQEPATLELFSKLSGAKPIDEISLGDNATWEGGHGALSQNHRKGTRPLLRTDEIRRLGVDRLLLIAKHHHPMVLEAVFYKSRAAWRRAAGRSPYYKE